jgi:Tol biopolymer transport system component
MPARLWLWGAAALAGTAITVGTIWGSQERQPLPQLTGPIRLAQLPPSGTTLVSGGVLSPDGRQMAFVARDRMSGKDSLWIQSLGAPEPQAVSGTEGASKPFWSPASNALGYFLGNALQVVTLAGDSPRTVASGVVVPGGGAWGEGNVLLFADAGRGIFSVPSAGGAQRQVTTIDPGSEVAHVWPQFLPGGTRFLYTVTAMDPTRAGTWVTSLDGSEAPSLLLPGRIGAVYSPSQHLLYVRHGSLYAERFDPSTVELSGLPLLVARNVPEPRIPVADRASASSSVLSFRSAARPHQLTWFDRTGRRIGTLSTPTSFHNPALSPDERVLAVTGLPSDTPGLWLIDLDRNASTLLEADGVGPVISPDSRQVAFTSRGGLEIRVRNLVGQATERVLLQDERRKVVQDWSPDGRYLIFSINQPRTGLDFWVLSLSETDSPRPLLETAGNERQARISPDGRWLAYASDESGMWEVYVQELPGLGSKRALSIGGGAGPMWAQNGRELFYLSTDKRLMSVEFGASGPRTPTRPVPLFSPPLSGDVWDARNYYVVSRDGERFLFNAVEENEDIPITVMVNWLAAARAAE